MAVLVALALLFAGCAGSAQENGVLAGHVTIGPLCPVEPCNISAERLAQVYASRNVTVFSDDGASPVAVAKINATGFYSVRLPAGTYMVGVEPGGIGRIPLHEANVSANRTTRLDLDVDTGIR